MKRLFLIASIIVCCLLSSVGPAHAQSAAARIKSRLTNYFTNYTNAAYSSNAPVRINRVEVDAQGRRVIVSVNERFAEQPFTRETVSRINSDVQRLMPPPYNTYRASILAGNIPIEELIPVAWSDTMPELRRWGNLEYNGQPWVQPLSRPYDISHGLQGRHIALWASHGSYYDVRKGIWKWQRPRLYCTAEDLFTQSFVVPFLMPMLESAGAYVFSLRERDWQREEVIVDNDMNTPYGVYSETAGLYEWETAGTGFGKVQDVYFDGENPFEAGTFRKAEARFGKRQLSQAVWQPRLPRDGSYAVYVSYATLPTSVSDAEYIVRHRGIETRFRVNQQMGGGTWVYLGTFDFAAGCDMDNCVLLTNRSSYRGVVTADAVRFGGGMGNVARGDSLHAFVRSNLPRALEGSRYYAQWAGMPYALYKNKDKTDDYAEDLNTRSLMTNRLACGSDYLPGDSGLNVPLELSLAVHSDAGSRPDSSIVGTLGIYTTGSNTTGGSDFEGVLAKGMFPSNRSRLMSRDLCDIVMTQIDTDIRNRCGTWNRRQMFDRNYSETRIPYIPSMILETLSHQNFADLCRGHDPSFKILLSRAIYKGILQYISTVHDCGPLVTQPLPVRDFSATVTAQGDSVVLSWQPVVDESEFSASPTGYIVYTAEGEQGYDNGRRYYTTQVTLPLRRNVLTKYKVRAYNEGGESMACEELCAYSPGTPRHHLLIINGFDRLAGPQPIDNDSLRGFDFNADPGVVYHRSFSYCGRQLCFNRENYTGFEESDPGFSSDEFEGILMAGNTFDFPTRHATDFLLGDSTLSISSCSASAFGQGRVPGAYHAIDLILGAQRQDGYSMNARPALSPTLSQSLQTFTQSGGALLTSGAYLSEEVSPEFAANVLHCRTADSYALSDSTATLTGMNARFTIYHEPNEEQYSIRRISVLSPAADAFSTVVSASCPTSLAVAYRASESSKGGTTLTYGFPLECVREPEIRQAIMAASLSFILGKP